MYTTIYKYTSEIKQNKKKHHIKTGKSTIITYIIYIYSSAAECKSTSIVKIRYIPTITIYSIYKVKNKLIKDN